MNHQANLTHIIEAALLAAGKPLSLKQLQGLFDLEEPPKKSALLAELNYLQRTYQDRGIEIIEVASGWRIQVRKQYMPWISGLWEEKPRRYSRALLETLALIAYRQPITRAEIEEIRGVHVSSQIIKTLLERDWIRQIGRREVVGRPALFATTKIFLDYFGLKSLNQLPKLEDIRDFGEIESEINNTHAKRIKIEE